MADIDLRRLEGDQIVIHFGGALNSVDAYTFANSLVAFADTVRAVNAVLNPSQGVEVRVEALGPGSFRAVVRRLTRGLSGFFSDGYTRIFWGIIAALIYDTCIRQDPNSRITINSNEVIIEMGKDRIVVPREVYDQASNAKRDPQVQKNLTRVFQVIEGDAAITNFGLTPQSSDPEPVVQIPRAIFPRLSAIPIPIGDDPKRRQRTEKARLLILKLWLTPGNRKWSFEWNGFPLSAPIKELEFWRRIERREILIGQGDALDAMLSYQQVFNEALQVFENDPHTFEVVEVLAHIPREGPQGTQGTFLTPS